MQFKSAAHFELLGLYHHQNAHWKVFNAQSSDWTVLSLCLHRKRYRKIAIFLIFQCWVTCHREAFCLPCHCFLLCPPDESRDRDFQSPGTCWVPMATCVLLRGFSFSMTVMVWAAPTRLSLLVSMTKKEKDVPEVFCLASFKTVMPCQGITQGIVLLQTGCSSHILQGQETKSASHRWGIYLHCNS